MSNLVLELRPGEMLIINGAPMRFRTKARIELTAKARFLFGKQIMNEADAITPARQLYFALQKAYIGIDEERGVGMEAARQLVSRCKKVCASQLASEIIDRALKAAEAEEHYHALKLIRRIIRYEEILSTQDYGAAAEQALVEPSTHSARSEITGRVTTMEAPVPEARHAAGLLAAAGPSA